MSRPRKERPEKMDVETATMLAERLYPVGKDRMRKFLQDQGVYVLATTPPLDLCAYGYSLGAHDMATAVLHRGWEPKVKFTIPEFSELAPETVADACKAIEDKINEDIGGMIERQARASEALWNA